MLLHIVSKPVEVDYKCYGISYDFRPFLGLIYGIDALQPDIHRHVVYHICYKGNLGTLHGLVGPFLDVSNFECGLQNVGATSSSSYLAAGMEGAGSLSRSSRTPAVSLCVAVCFCSLGAGSVSFSHKQRCALFLAASPLISSGAYLLAWFL